MIFNPEMNRVTVDQSVEWVTLAFKEIARAPKLFALNVASVFCITACIDLFIMSMPLMYLLYVMYFCIFGTVILNLNSYRRKQEHLISFYAGFKAPYMSRLLKSCTFMLIGSVAALAASMCFLYYKGFFNPENIEQLKLVISRLTSPEQLKQLEVAFTKLSSNPADLSLLAELFPGVELNSVLVLIQQLMISLMIFFLLFLLVASYFWLVPYFCTLCYEDLQNKKLNMYGLSFKAAFSFKNFLPMLGFGVSIFVITFIYNLLLSQMILSIGNSTLQVLAEALKDAVSSCFILYAVYFLFLDLFSNHREEKQEVEAERIDPKRKMAANAEIKKL